MLFLRLYCLKTTWMNTVKPYMTLILNFLNNNLALFKNLLECVYYLIIIEKLTYFTGYSIGRVNNVFAEFIKATFTTFLCLGQ